MELALFPLAFLLIFLPLPFYVPSSLWGFFLCIFFDIVHTFHVLSHEVKLDYCRATRTPCNTGKHFV